MRSKSRKMRKSEHRALDNLNKGGLWTNLSEAPVCPYCGKKMILRTSDYVGSVHENQMKYVCQGYPECDVQARAIEKDGAWQLISTPADKNLRALRREAHFWMDKLEETKTVEGKRAIAFFISSKSMISAGKWVHIGQCREAACMEIIEICVNALYDNRENFDRFPGYAYSCTFKKPELWEKVKRIAYNPKNNA